MIVSAVAALILAAKGPDLPPAYIPKHPDIVIGQPVFDSSRATLKQSKQVAAIVGGLIAEEPQDHKALITFVGVAGAIYINAHRAQIIDCTDHRGWKYGPGQADPYCVWPRPQADDWMGCMLLQFQEGERTLEKFKLDTLSDDQSVFIWIDQNYDRIIKEKDGAEFIRQLNGIPVLGAACEKVVQDEVPEGSFTAGVTI